MIQESRKFHSEINESTEGFYEKRKNTQTKMGLQIEES